VRTEGRDVGGRPVRSLVHGEQRAGVPELVLVPGLGAMGYLLPTVHSCATWTRVHLLDVPGFGDRRTARLRADLDSLGTTVARWLPERPVLLLGHSTGAQVALHAALAQPASVRTLVLAGATFSPEARRVLPLLGQVLRTLPHEQLGEVPAVLPYYLRGLRRMPQLLRTTLADRPEDAVPRLAVPRVVLRGEHDHLCPRPWAARLSPDVREVPGGHNVPWTHPGQVSQVLRSLA
jgi:pimeloyl-ACP methyl ester carboxylesterase